MTGYLVLAGVGVVGALLFAASMTARRLLAPRAPSPAKLTTYESGVDPVTGGWAQSHIRYVAYAFLYVVFAVDAVYLFPWALVLRNHRLGVVSLVEMGIFIAVVLVGLLHAARRGLLTWSDHKEPQ
ncbi:NADH-quinone oxidoreductase subunit A [Rudaeicoccus suwonensis]|uniref:NADH-quinone oxidoreductase subunit A n=1 Tax=Rudaeicoccus suwonensis TaxID=657409 RepID=UPI00119E4BDF